MSPQQNYSDFKEKDMSELHKEIILTYISCYMNISKTAKALHLHRNTVTYHLYKIREVTGLDPFNFHDLVKLMKLAEEI